MRGFLGVPLALALFAGTAHAHLLPKQTATMNILGRAAFCVVSIPASALTGVDDDGNGRLSLAEVQRHAADIQRQFAARFHISNDGRAALRVQSWVSPPADDGAGTDYVVLLHRADFGEAPANPELTTDLFGTGPGEQQMTIKATHERGGNKVSEVAILQASAPSHRFFKGRWATFADFVGIGIDHILGGADHLLFLLTIIVAAAGWRYWLGVVTSFTIAHSFTLALSALGTVRLPASIIEPGIAASIVMMALLNLRQSDAMTSRSSHARLAIVFACGLLHGFGFSSAIGSMAVDTGSRLATLAGFNVGIEIGQFLFLSSIVLVVALGRRCVPSPARWSLPLVASAIAVVLGTAMLIDRVVPLAKAL